jgi:hypothetical protein
LELEDIMAVDVSSQVDQLWSAVKDASTSIAGEKVYIACLELHELTLYLQDVGPDQIELGPKSNDPLYSYLNSIQSAVTTNAVRNAAAAVEAAVMRKISRTK